MSSSRSGSHLQMPPSIHPNDEKSVAVARRISIMISLITLHPSNKNEAATTPAETDSASTVATS